MDTGNPNTGIDHILYKLNITRDMVNSFILTNGICVKLYKLLEEHLINEKELIDTLCYLCKVISVNKSALMTKLKRTYATYRTKRNKYLESFLLQTFSLPATVPPFKIVAPQPESRIIENKSQVQLKLELSKAIQKLDSAKITLAHRKNRINILQEQHKQSLRKLKRLKIRHQKTLLASVDVKSNKTKKLVRNIHKISSVAMTGKLEKSVELLKSKIRNVKRELLNKDRKINMLNRAIRSNDNLKTILAEKDSQIENHIKKEELFKTEIRDLTEENQYLKNLLQDNSQINLINDSGSYSTKMVHCVMDLVSAGIPCSSVSYALERVAEICGHCFDKLPSRRTVDYIAQRRLSVSHHHLADLAKESNQTLHTDETSKFGKQYMVYVSTTSKKKPMVLGLKPIASKSANDTLLTLQNTLRTISTTCNNPNLGKQIICNLKNTMSDRASTEKLFNEILTEYRSSLLPEIVDNFDKLSEDDIISAKQMNNFFCGLHLLISLAEVTAKCLKPLENFDDPIGAEADKSTRLFIKTSESSIMRYIRTSCKLFAKSVKLNNDNNCFGAFTAYLQTLNMNNVLVEFLNNRFNIVFYDAEAVYYLSSSMTNFIENVHGISTTLFKAVLLDSKDDWCVAGAKALGILSKIITAPLWRVLEDNEVEMSEIGPIYSELVTFLNICGNSAENVALLRTGMNRPFCFANKVKEDFMYQALMKEDLFDTKVDDILRHVCKEWAILLGRLLEDHLPGGKYHEMSENQKHETSSVIKHNKVAEEMFGQLDRLMRIKPNSSILSHEAQIMFRKNETSKWLDSIPETDRSSILKNAYKETQVLKTEHKQLEEDIKAYKAETLADKTKKIENKRAKDFQEKENLTNSMLYYGLWQSVQQVDLQIQTIKSKTEKLTALKTQINFRKTVLGQPAEKDLYKFSSKGIGVFSIDILQANLCKLIELASESNIINTGHFLVGQNVRHKFDNEGNEEWFEGRVISQVPGFESWFNTVYRNDDAVYTFQLMEDYCNGGLVIILETGNQEVIIVVKLMIILL